MERNVGNVDRIARTVLGLAILTLVFFGPQTAWGYVGLIALVTAASGFCPLYKILGFHTLPASGANPIDTGSKRRS
jgi:hypothetical protein